MEDFHYQIYNPNIPEKPPDTVCDWIYQTNSTAEDEPCLCRACQKAYVAGNEGCCVNKHHSCKDYTCEDFKPFESFELPKAYYNSRKAEHNKPIDLNNVL